VDVLVIVGVFVRVAEGLGANVAEAVSVAVGVLAAIVELGGGVTISSVSLVKALQPTILIVSQARIRPTRD